MPSLKNGERCGRLLSLVVTNAENTIARLAKDERGNPYETGQFDTTVELRCEECGQTTSIAKGDFSKSKAECANNSCPGLQKLQALHEADGVLRKHRIEKQVARARKLVGASVGGYGGLGGSEGSKGADGGVGEAAGAIAPGLTPIAGYLNEQRARAEAGIRVDGVFKRSPGRPTLPVDLLVVQLPISIPSIMLSWITKRAQVDGVSRSQWVREVIEGARGAIPTYTEEDAEGVGPILDDRELVKYPKIRVNLSVPRQFVEKLDKKARELDGERDAESERSGVGRLIRDILRGKEKL